MVTKFPFLPEDHHFALANVAARAGQLDYHIEETINRLLFDAQNTAKCVLHNLGSDRLVDLLGALLRDKFPADHETIENLIKTIKCARRQRNELLHQIWGPSDNTEYAILASFRPHREETIRRATADDIQAAADKLYECTKALIRWQELHFQQRQTPSPDRCG